MGPRARVALFRALGGLMERLPERVDVALARALAGAWGRRNVTARAHLSKNLSRVLAGPGEPVSDELLQFFVARGFENYGQYWAEGAKLPGLNPERIYSRFAIAEGREHLEAAKARGRGLIIALPHIGSWEWGGAFLYSIGLGMTAVAEELDPPAMFEWFTKKREAIGISIEPLNDQAGAVLLSTLRANGVVGLLCDRDLQENGIEVDFFGSRVRLPGGPATLALRTGATLVVAACYTGPGRDHYAVVLPPINTERSEKLRADVARVTQDVARNLEDLIRRAPEQWHVLEDRFA